MVEKKINIFHQFLYITAVGQQSEEDNDSTDFGHDIELSISDGNCAHFFR